MRPIGVFFFPPPLVFSFSVLSLAAEDIERAPSEYCDLMRACWNGLPRERPSFRSVLASIVRMSNDGRRKKDNPVTLIDLGAIDLPTVSTMIDFDALGSRVLVMAASGLSKSKIICCSF